jgi:hypothetical protein
MARQPLGWTLDAASALAMQMYLAPETAGRFGLRGSYEIDYRGLYPHNLELFTRLLRRLEGTDLHLRFLQLANVTEVVALHREGLESLEHLGEVAGLFRAPIQVFRVPRPLARTFAVGRARRADGLAGLTALLSPDFEARDEVVLSQSDPLPPADSFVGTSRVVASTATRVTLEASLNAPGYVVLLDGYDPGWLAEVDGKPAPVLCANVAFRAIALPAGHHVIQLVYRPRTVLVGLTLSATTLLALLGAALRLHRVARSGSSRAVGSST